MLFVPQSEIYNDVDLSLPYTTENSHYFIVTQKYTRDNFLFTRFITESSTETSTKTRCIICHNTDFQVHRTVRVANIHTDIHPKEVQISQLNIGQTPLVVCPNCVDYLTKKIDEIIQENTELFTRTNI